MARVPPFIGIGQKVRTKQTLSSVTSWRGAKSIQTGSDTLQRCVGEVLPFSKKNLKPNRSVMPRKRSKTRRNNGPLRHHARGSGSDDVLLRRNYVVLFCFLSERPTGVVHTR